MTSPNRVATFLSAESSVASGSFVRIVGFTKKLTTFLKSKYCFTFDNLSEMLRKYVICFKLFSQILVNFLVKPTHTVLHFFDSIKKFLGIDF